VLYVTAEVLRQLGILTQPYVPAAAERLLDMLGISAGERQFANLGPAGRLEPGTQLPAPQGIFPRYVEAEKAESGA
jgi:methionyl-tRNA synthetase